MSGNPGVPRDVLALIAEHVPTMAHVELLLLLSRTSPRGWTVDEAAAELRGTASTLVSSLLGLTAAGLAVVQARADGSEEFMYAPTSEAQRETVAELRELYERRPVTLVNALYQKPRSAAESFADAFRLRKD